MNKIKEILESCLYENMSIDDMEKIGLENFRLFNDNNLKEEYVYRWLKKQGPDCCGRNDMRKTAAYLVEEGLFMEELHEV